MSLNDEFYKNKLSDQAYKVCRLAATEQPFSGIYNDHWQQGTYHCACCEQALFESAAKFNAGCGWPSFFQALDQQIRYVEDNTLAMARTEIQCKGFCAHPLEIAIKPIFYTID
jgi:peptide-methionine (R)-S-oxide reductase